MTSADIEIHERLVKLETVGKNQTDSISKLVDVMEKHCINDNKRYDDISSRINSLETSFNNISFGGRMLLKFIIGCIMIGSTLYGFFKWFHDVALSR